MSTIILKGNILYSNYDKKVTVIKNGYLVGEGEKIVGTFQYLPENYKDIPIIDYTDKLIIPGFCDMHLHAPQFYQRGVGMDLQLLEWLNTYTFPNESTFKDENVAKEVYDKLVKNLIANGTMYACMFGTVHRKSNNILIKYLEDNKLRSFVGKVNMDMNCPDYIIESTSESLMETELFIEENQYNKYAKPIITPRFSPSCTEKIHEKLGELSLKYNVPVQSHLCESIGEINAVKELFPNYDEYSQVYMKNNLLGPMPSIMAHCVYLTEEDKKNVKAADTFLVHCPTSNSNIITGIMPAKKLLNEGYNVCMGSDIGGGHTTALYKEMATAIRHSKILSYMTGEDHYLNIEDVFYMATLGGGKFFSTAGSFLPGYDFTALVIDDTSIDGFKLEPLERLERFCHIGDDRNIIARYSLGNFIKIS